MQCVQEARRREVGKEQEARISRALQAMVISLDSMLSVMGSQCKRYSDLSFCSWNLKSQEWIVWGSTASNRVHTIYLRLTTIFQSFSKCNSKLCTWGKVDIFLQPQQSTNGVSMRDLKEKNWQSLINNKYFQDPTKSELQEHAIDNLSLQKPKV